MWFLLSQRKATIFGTLTNLCSGEGGETAEKTCQITALGQWKNQQMTKVKTCCNKVQSATVCPGDSFIQC